MELVVTSNWETNSAGNDELHIAGYEAEIWFEESPEYTGYAWEVRREHSHRIGDRVIEGQASTRADAQKLAETAIRDAYRDMV